MKCANCKTEVSMSDSKCPKCGNNLLEFGATVFYEPKEKDSQRYGQQVKDMVFGGLHKDVKETVKSLDAEETRIFMPTFEKRILSLISRHLSDEELDQLYNQEIIPILEELSKEKTARMLFAKIESEIKDKLGEPIFDHYKNKGNDVLKILRAGELTNVLVKNNMKDIDLTVKSFPYFKSSEVACRIHSSERCKSLKNHSIIYKMDEWIGGNKDNLYGGDIPEWIEKKKGFLNVIDMLLDRKPPFDLTNCRSTGISLYIFGRKSIEIRGKLFHVNNMFNTYGPLEDKAELSSRLCELQDLRNARVHEKIEVDESEVNNRRLLTYACLKSIPKILEI